MSTIQDAKIYRIKSIELQFGPGGSDPSSWAMLILGPTGVDFMACRPKRNDPISKTPPNGGGFFGLGGFLRPRC
jgi:hypothetical protein